MRPVEPGSKTARGPISRWCWLLAAGMALIVSITATAQPPSEADGDVKPEEKQPPLVLPPQSKPAPVQRTLDYWVTQLNHDQYLRREQASKKLAAAGPQAVPVLVKALQSGDLETVERATTVMRDIALSQPPDDDGGAWGSLTNLASTASGIRASSAQVAIDEVRKYRAEQARKALIAAGVFVGTDDFIVRSVSRPRQIVQIDEGWNEDLAVLQWLRWLEGIEYARVKATAVRHDVLGQLVKIPDLRTLAIVDAEVNSEILSPLQSMHRIHSLEFRYVRLTPELCDLIVKMPVRVSLNLMGTGVTAEKVEEMRRALPGLAIDHRQGGFLGVTCFDTQDECQINTVVDGGAAEAAGLIPGDVIVQIAGAEVNRFKDLQNAINQHLPGDEVEVKYRRGNKILSVKLRLRRLGRP